MLVFIDDATSKLMQMGFLPSESTDSYFAALEGYLNDHGCHVAFYSDKKLDWQQIHGCSYCDADRNRSRKRLRTRASLSSKSLKPRNKD